MDTSRSELDAIRRILSELITRVARMERKLGMETEYVAHEPATEAAQPPRPAQTVTDAVLPRTAPPSVSPPSKLPPLVAPAVKSKLRPETEINLESRIGSHWLNRIGIAALLIGISYFLKLAFDSNWIGPAGRVTIGLLAGISVVVWSERFRAKGYKAFSYSLKAVGIGALYLSLWAAFQVYNLIPSSAAFVMMLAVTASTAIDTGLPRTAGTRGPR